MHNAAVRLKIYGMDVLQLLPVCAHRNKDTRHAYCNRRFLVNAHVQSVISQACGSVISQACAERDQSGMWYVA